MHEERSQSGQPIYRYDKPAKELQIPEVHAECCEQITRHVKRHIGPVKTVLHEILSNLVHIDVLLVEPTPAQPFYTLVTSGMSDRPMSAPKQAAGCEYAELVIRLPATWPIPATGEVLGGDKTPDSHYWPIGLLKMLARFPHKYETWLWAGHTMPNGDPPKPWSPNTELCGVVLFPSITLPKSFMKLAVHDNKQINFLSVYPIYKEEMDLKLKKGSDALVAQFERIRVTDVLNLTRRNSCAKRWWNFGSS